MGKTIIGVTDCNVFDRYARWTIKEEDIEVIKLSYKENNFTEVEKCQGLVLSGGEDVHPRFYNKPEYVPYCLQDYMDEKRDEFELSLLDFAQKNSLPLMGICRGLQLVNVYYGGTLIPDIPSFGKFNHSKKDKKDRYHSVMVDPNSILNQIVKVEQGEVNSLHHQSADLVASELVANAMSPDGVVEGLERKNPEGKPFLMLVQWHPEGMIDQESPFTKNIQKSFLEAVLQQQTV